ncbi:phage repressor protein C with HTH and peptisase S24 domain [Flavobacterium sp. 2755]|uniref:S24 family peptidase n=1 Tax=Flavobacterium sp. 2755 TaxID=2817765 RepID=UPI00285CFA7F|nr:S24 family peptidase [Flavobacterium sp. 2755]MDR6760515.1 phage repressor protein C with HTH and peptisase S24 domain [Flavobacterium sp. 2755]
MTDLQRIKIALEALISLGAAKNQEEVGKLLGYSNKSSFSHVLNGKVNLPADFVDRLCALSTAINKDWIKYGIGNILKNNDDADADYNGKNDNSYINTSFAGVSHKNYTLPLISAETMIEYNSGNKEITDLNAVKFLIPTFKDSDYLMTVTGSSMYPNYNNGDIVACKHLSPDTFFQWNKVYVVNTEQGVLVKRICKSDNDDFVTVVSDNKDYAPFELPKSKVLSIAIVTGVIRLE